MCFERLYAVPFVEEPDFTRELKILKGVADIPFTDAVDQIGITAKILLDNAIVAEVMREAAKHYVQVNVVEPTDTIEELEDRSVVFSSPVMSSRFLNGQVHPEVLTVTHHKDLQGTVVVMKLKDFSFVAMYSLVVAPPTGLPEGTIALAELRIKFGLESESVRMYRDYAKEVEMNTPAPQVLSTFRKMWNHSPMTFPDFSGLRVMMMPVKLGYLDGVPDQYKDFVYDLYGMVESRFLGEVGYLTIDERELQPGETLRRSGLHVDGYYQGRCGAWGGGGGWGSVGNGMLTVSSTPHCKAWLGIARGEIGSEGEADQMDLSSCGSIVFGAGDVYWVDGACIHESLPVEETTKRQFVRLSMPNNGPWFEGYTENPTGIKPSNDILPARDKFMKG